jgi:hypothetical protein
MDPLGISKAVDEVERTAQQFQRTGAAAEEVLQRLDAAVAKADALLDKLTLIVDAISRAGK